MKLTPRAKQQQKDQVNEEMMDDIKNVDEINTDVIGQMEQHNKEIVCSSSTTADSTTTACTMSDKVDEIVNGAALLPSSNSNNDSNYHSIENQTQRIPDK